MIEKEFFVFLEELSRNNNKVWFDANRNRYEQFVKKPFESLVVAIGNELGKFDAEIQGDFKKNIFRINKDIRFSKDKTPYKTNRSAAFSLHGKKDHDAPGYYIELGVEKCYIAGGSWCPDAENLYKIRSEIYYNQEEFNAIISEPRFKRVFHDIQGEKSKLLPKNIKEWGHESEYIYNKQFYFWKEFSTDNVYKKDFISKIVADFQIGYKVNQFLRRAIRD